MKLSQILGQRERDLSKLNEVEKRKIAMTGIDRLIEAKKDLDRREEESQYGNGVKLNLGCGNRKMEGFINIDSKKSVKPNILWDLEKGLPKSIKDDSVTGIYASNILEYIKNLTGLMEDIYKKCKNGAKIRILIPHYKSHHAFDDPTHVRFFTETTFQYFSKEHREKNLPLFDYSFNCDFTILNQVVEENGLMTTVLEVIKCPKKGKKKQK